MTNRVISFFLYGDCNAGKASLYFCKPYLLHPETIYECTGDVPNVCFPCAALHDPSTGRVAVYYGAADTVVGLAFGYIDEIVEFTKKTSIL